MARKKTVDTTPRKRLPTKVANATPRTRPLTKGDKHDAEDKSANKVKDKDKDTGKVTNQRANKTQDAGDGVDRNIIYSQKTSQNRTK